MTEWIAVKGGPLPVDTWADPPKDRPRYYWVYLPCEGKEYRTRGPIEVKNGMWMLGGTFSYPQPNDGIRVTHYMPYYTPEPPDEQTRAVEAWQLKHDRAAREGGEQWVA